MSYASENGYTPVSTNEIINFVRQKVNEVFNNSYTVESFIGTNWYKFAYALSQKINLNEVKTGEIFQKLQQYIALTNERIQRPSVSAPGVIDSLLAKGFVASAKPPHVDDAGTVSICVDLDDGDADYPADKLEVCTHLKDFLAMGTVFIGAEVETIVLSNGQAFDYKFALPTPIPVKLKVTITVSENNLDLVPGDEEVRQFIFDRIHERYRLGLNFEPQRYFNLADAPYAGDVLFQWSDDFDPGPATYHSTVYDTDFDELITFGLEDIQVIFA